MNLQDAIKQYAEMVKLGAHALERLAERQLNEREKEDLKALLDEVIAKTDKMIVFAER